MSKCISNNGEYSEHEPGDQEFVCGRCFAFDEDAAVAEIESLRQQLAESESGRYPYAEEVGRAYRRGFKAGRASRDTEVAELEAGRNIEQTMLRNGAELVEALRQQLAEATKRADGNYDDAHKWRAENRRCYQLQEGQAEEIQSLRQQLAEREAVIERVRAYAEDRAFHARGHLNTVNSGRIASDLQAILAASPSAVLAEHEER